MNNKYHQIEWQWTVIVNIPTSKFTFLNKVSIFYINMYEAYLYMINQSIEFSIFLPNKFMQYLTSNNLWQKEVEVKMLLFSINCTQLYNNIQTIRQDMKVQSRFVRGRQQYYLSSCDKSQTHSIMWFHCVSY
jgi:hypothetical protein